MVRSVRARGPIPDPPHLASRPWYGADRTLPAYRFVPGLHPHPTRSPAGHSDGRPAELHPAWRPDEWRRLEPYLRGVDLFNRWYFWEAHEAWEVLWKAHNADTDPARFIQGLIGSAAALLKVHTGDGRAARKLLASVHDRWTGVRGFWMGLDLDAFRADLDRYFDTAADGAPPSLGPETPVIRLID